MPRDIEHVLQETRSFPPSDEFRKKARIQSEKEYRKLWRWSIDDPQSFWDKMAKQELSWFKYWESVLEWNPPSARWFSGATLNASYNCLDRHLESDRKNKAALIWEGEPGDTRVLTYLDLHRETCRFAHALEKLGVRSGDRVAIYLPLVPEIAIAMLACARIGATHTVIFAGFSSDAIADRCNDAQVKLIITADGGWRKGAQVPLKRNVDEALNKTQSVERVIVLRRTMQDVSMHLGRDYWWHELTHDASNDFDPKALDAEHPLFILYTSGSTGTPKGVLHTTAGYLLQASLSAKYIFDLQENDTYWCTADAGWITGHSYLIYGPLTNGATVFMYEGAPNIPDWGRFWELIEKYRINILYTAPTAIRTFIKFGRELPSRYDLSSLRLLGSVGEPINPEAWIWYHEVIGRKKCPIVDTWWQTETGSIMLSPLPGVTTTIPGSATKPFFGVDADIVDKDGNSLAPNEGGFLVIRKPWPSMLRTIWGNEERYQKAYWSQIPGVYFTGDGARRDDHGNFWIMGRIDDVLNVSGHRLSTMEIESACVSHPLVAEAAVVGYPHDIKGEAIACFITVAAGTEPNEDLKQEIIAHVSQHIGGLARPDMIRFAESLPKTRSGKIMRRLLRDIAAGRESKGDTTTLEDFSVLAKLRETEE